MASESREPRHRAHLLEAIANSWNACVDLIDALADDQWTGPTDAQGWTVKDHVARVAAWENVAIEVFRSASPQYITLQIPEFEWASTGIEGADALIHARTSGQSLRRVKNNRDVTHARIVTILSELPEEDFQRPFSDFGAVGSDQSMLLEMMDHLVRRYDTLCASIKSIVGMDEAAPSAIPNGS